MSITTAELVDALMVVTNRLINYNVWESKHFEKPIPDLYKSGVRYKRHSESHDTCFSWQRKQEADIVSLVAWRVAELRAQGEDAKPVFQWTQTGAHTIHIGCLVRRASGEFEDVTKELQNGR